MGGEISSALNLVRDVPVGLHRIKRSREQIQLEQLIAVEVVSEAPRSILAVRKRAAYSRLTKGDHVEGLDSQMVLRRSSRKVEHLGYIVRRDAIVVTRISCLAKDSGNLPHSANTNNSLDCKVGLVREGTLKVISRDLIRRDERIRDKEARPLCEQRVSGRYDAVVARLLRVRERHD